ncbi:MAG: hypothetical protein ACI9H6_000739 [Patiriisocius sp.]|jgi:hypothetical protein
MALAFALIGVVAVALIFYSTPGWSNLATDAKLMVSAIGVACGILLVTLTLAPVTKTVTIHVQTRRLPQF